MGVTQLHFNHLAPSYRPSVSYVGYPRAQSAWRGVMEGMEFHVSVFGPSYGPASPRGKAALYLAATGVPPGAPNRLPAASGRSRRRRDPGVAGPGRETGDATARSEESALDDPKTGTAATWRPQRRRTCERSPMAAVLDDLDATRAPSYPSTAK